METKKLLQFMLVFAVLAGFTAISLGAATRDSMIPFVTAARDNNAHLVSIDEPSFDTKVLSFLSEEKICMLTEEQTATLAETYETESRTFTTDEGDVSVTYLLGTPINEHILEDALGEEIGEEDCQAVHGNKVVALLSPTLVS